MLFGLFALGGMAPNIGAYGQAKAAGMKAFSIIDRAPTILLDDENAIEHKMKGTIKFENVDFFYPKRPDAHVLRNLNFEFELGKTTAIVGPSGSGKSTVV